MLTMLCRGESMALANGDLEDACAALAGFYANVRAAGRPGLADAIPGILAQLRGIGREVEAAVPADIGEPPADWYLKD